MKQFNSKRLYLNYISRRILEQLYETIINNINLFKAVGTVCTIFVAVCLSIKEPPYRRRLGEKPKE